MASCGKRTTLEDGRPDAAPFPAVRLRVHVEGQTEEAFVNRLLAPHLGKRGFTSVDARLMGGARRRRQRGGVPSWTSFRNELVRHLKADSGLLHTSIVDFYGMPDDGKRAWPGRREAASLPHARKGEHVAQQMLADLHTVWHREQRFVPFVVMHEFEALLFSDCDAFANVLAKPGLAGELRHIRDQFESPEHINDRRDTAPSSESVRCIQATARSRKAPRLPRRYPSTK